jgi:hypothetical protein
MKTKPIFAGVAAVLLSATAAFAQSITPMREWVPNIDQAAAAARAHQATHDPTPSTRTQSGMDR